MIIATIRNDAYSHSNLINITFPIDEGATMAKLSEICISDRRNQNE